MPISPAKSCEASCALPGDEGLEAGPDDRGLLTETAQLRGTDQQRVIDVQRRPHMHQYASSMHTTSSQVSPLRIGHGYAVVAIQALTILSAADPSARCDR